MYKSISENHPGAGDSFEEEKMQANDFLGFSEIAESDQFGALSA